MAMTFRWNSKAERQSDRLCALLASLANHRASENRLEDTFDMEPRVVAALEALRLKILRLESEADTLLGAVTDIQEKHRDGWIDERIDPDALSGPFAQTATRVNELVASHIAVKMKVVDVVKAYAAGDFSVQIDRMPGKKATITAAMDEAKASFEAVARNRDHAERFKAALLDVRKLHDEGWIDEQIDASKLVGNYADAARIVNELVASHIAVKMKVVDVVQAYARGDFSVDMDRLPGKKAQITAAIDGVKASFEGLSTSIAHLAKSAARGDFTVRGDVGGFENAFRTMIVDLNTLMETADVGLNEVARVLSAIARGDLTEQITNDYAGTFGQLKNDSNATVSGLAELITQIKRAVEMVSNAASEIAAGNNDLSARTEEQASSLEETASSMEELTTTVKQNADNARQANQLAIGASEIARKGGEVVGGVVQMMASINESSRKIVDIISVIDGIAFQTNILALNAAVEAARAGEQGRGFAVVAGEVRSLAQRSAEAAKEIKSLIGDSVEKASAGSKLVDEAGVTMTEIVGSVKRVTEIMSQIASASSEQRIGIEQINQTIAQLEQVTQQNASLVGRAAESAAALDEEAQNLMVATSAFRLSKESTPPRILDETHTSGQAGAGTAHTLGTRATNGAARREQVAAKRLPVAANGTRAHITDDEDWKSF